MSKPFQELLDGCKTLVFDCDGVLLNSNRIKTEGFREVAKQFSSDAADALVEYHVQNGGISRYLKFEYLLVEILGLHASKTEIEKLANQYGNFVYRQLLTCPVTQGLEELRKATKNMKWMVVSGGNQEELRSIFAERGLDELFDNNIYGSPRTKDEILNQIISDGVLQCPALFLGDSRYDHEAASRAGLHFVFVYEWTEFTVWKEYCRVRRIPTIDSVRNIFS